MVNQETRKDQVQGQKDLASSFPEESGVELAPILFMGCQDI